MYSNNHSINDIRISSYLNYFWIGFSIYSLAFTFPVETQLSYYIFQALQLSSIVIFVPAAYQVINWKIDSVYLKTIIIGLLLWNVTILARGFSFNYEFIKRMLIYADDGLFLYLIPIIALFPPQIKYLRKVSVLIIIFGTFFILYSLLRLDVLLDAVTGSRNATGTIDQLVQCLAIPSGFILISYLYHPKKIRIMAVIILLIALYFTVVRARRGFTIILSSMILVSYLFHMVYNREKLFRLFLTVTMLIILVSVVALAYRVEKYSFFGHLTSRIDEDTRKGVEQAFYDDMSTTDWIIGKGINGTYYCPNIDEGYRVTVYRNTIETGYLQIILRGGIISLFLFLLAAVPAIFKGFFASRNMLCKAAGAWILLFLGYSYPMTIGWFILSTLLIWISIGLCNSKKILKMTDEEIFKELA